MQIGQRLREFREAKNLSQGDIERRTGLVPPYISRVENGHTVPSIETLEKFARAFGVPTYQFFVGAEEQPDHVGRAIRDGAKGSAFGNSSREQRYLVKLWRLFEMMSKPNRDLLLSMSKAMAGRNRTRAKKTGRPPRGI